MNDLDKARDEKCIPVAREIMKDMAVDLFDADATKIVVKMLTHALATDMNIVVEVSYLPQLILGALAGLNKAVQTADMVAVDEARYKEIAKKMLVITNEANIRLGNVTPEESDADFAPVKAKFGELFLTEKLTSIEVKYIVDSIFGSFSVVNNLFSESMAQHTEKATAKILGLESTNDLGTKQIDEILKS